MKSFPVHHYPNGQIGTVNLEDKTVKHLEKIMEIKLENFEAEPFVVAFTFQVDNKTGKFTLQDMRIHEQPL